MILKNDQAYFKNLVVFIFQNYEWNGEKKELRNTYALFRWNSFAEKLHDC